MNAKRLYNILIIKVIGGKSTPIDSSLCHSCHYSSEDSFRFRLSNSFRYRLTNSFHTLLPLLLLLTSCETIDLNDHESGTTEVESPTDTLVSMPRQLLCSLNSWKLVGYQQPKSISVPLWANTRVSFTRDSVRFFYHYDDVITDTAVTSSADETLYTHPVSYDHSLVTFDGATYVVCHHLTYAPRKIYSLDSRDITLIIEDIETTSGPSPP